MKRMNLSEARAGLLKLADELERDPSTVVEVSRRGKPVMALVSADLYEAIIETLEILGDEEAHRDLRRALREVDEGKAVAWESVKDRL